MSSLFFPHLKGVKLGAGKIPAAILLPLGNPKPLFKGPRVPHDPGHGAKHGPSSPQDPRFPGFPMAPAGGKMCCTGETLRPCGVGALVACGARPKPGAGAQPKARELMAQLRHGANELMAHVQ